MHWFHHPYIELLGRYPDGLLLQSDEKVDSRDKVRGMIEGEEIPMTLKNVHRLELSSRVWLDSIDKLRQRLHVPARKHLYRAELENPQACLPHLRVLLEPAPNEYEEERDQPRFAHHLRVRGPQLPGFEGDVYDLSLSGIRLEVGAGGGRRLERNTRLELEMDLDHESARPIKLLVEVRWARPVRDHYEIGAQYVKLGLEERQALIRFLDYLAQQQEDGLVGGAD